MSQRSHPEKSPAAVTLHPLLEKALSSLDVQLEEELARYRRHRLHQHVAPSSEPEPELEKTAPPVSQQNDIVNLAQQSASTATKPSAHPPQDYMQSSEQLLKNLEQKKAIKPKTTIASTGSGLTVWHVGTAAVLGVTATLIGLSLRGTQPVAQDPTPSSSPANSVNSQATQSSPLPSGAPLDLQGPNLAEEESAAPTDGLPAPPQPEAVPSPSPTASPAIPGRESDLPSALLGPNLQPAPTPDAPEETGTAVNPPVAVAPGPSANDRFFYVLVEYTDAASLDRARSAVPNAYPRQFAQGIQIQMGAFDTVGDAEQLVNALKTRGIVATVYRAAQ